MDTEFYVTSHSLVSPVSRTTWCLGALCMDDTTFASSTTWRVFVTGLGGGRRWPNSCCVHGSAHGVTRPLTVGPVFHLLPSPLGVGICSHMFSLFPQCCLQQHSCSACHQRRCMWAGFQGHGARTFADSPPEAICNPCPLPTMSQ